MSAQVTERLAFVCLRTTPYHGNAGCKGALPSKLALFKDLALVAASSCSFVLLYWSCALSFCLMQRRYGAAQDALHAGGSVADMPPVELSSNRRAALSDFTGGLTLDVREMYTDSAGELQPGKKGLWRMYKIVALRPACSALNSDLRYTRIQYSELQPRKQAAGHSPARSG